jgi:hypothetical protein
MSVEGKEEEVDHLVGKKEKARAIFYERNT